MGMSYRPILLFRSLFSLFLSSSAQNCSYSFSSNRVYNSCNALPQLNAYIYYTYHASNGTVDIAYRAAASNSSNWVAWAINPNGLRMIGSQALVAYQNSSGIQVYTAPITTYAIQRGNLSFPVSGLAAEYASSEFIIYATLTLTNNSTTVNQVWQQGTLSNGVPLTHPTSGPNVQSMGTLNFTS
ncbi:cytochrome b561 and DOMON domain-containing protein [Cinnamomum micranthum f. kanehirae]|uniref:Cytochrome b561 and DOMON domain-containing protein n=1 Tax=Cinnamomum micranthum f. kanehirae TaxID=337451 RepID=A0A3S3R8C5_9MAGN|nr:cytochrome b561 and DOMON domain-containing protein [Cinnamomum micranthum f. kanehirae]